MLYNDVDKKGEKMLNHRRSFRLLRGNFFLKKKIAAFFVVFGLFNLADVLHAKNGYMIHQQKGQRPKKHKITSLTLTCHW